MARDGGGITSGAEAAESLAARVRDAATQRLHLRARESDQEFRAEGGTVIYSIDTDIVVLYLDPATAPAPSPAGPGSRHYTHVFEDDPEDLSVALGKHITDFVFYRLRNQAPIVMAAPLQRELARVFEGIAAAAGTEQLAVENELQALKDSIRKVGHAFQKAPTKSEQLDLLLDLLPNLRRFLFGFGGPSMMLARLEDLLTRTRLVGLNRARERHLGLSKTTLQALARPGSLGDFVDFQRSRERWKASLTKTKSPKTPHRNIDADCEVLAWLELVNDRAHGNVRVVHVTGDRAMFEAARSCNATDKESFAQRFLRDPRAFLAEPEVFFGEDDGAQSPGEFVEWLDVFLGKFMDESRLEELASGHEVDRDVVMQVLDDDVREVERFDSRWEAFCRPMVLDLAGVSSQSSTPWQQYLNALARHGIDLGVGHDEIYSLEAIIESLEEMIDVRINETWRKCFNTSTRIGFDLLHFGDESHRSRYAPPITFPGYPVVSQFFSEMLRGATDLDRKLVGDALDDVPEYVFYLVFGGLFGAEGRWPLARVLADRAIAAIPPPDEQSEEPGERISGREAHYLRAIAGRLTAPNMAAIDDAEASLARAYEALAADRSDNPEHTVTTLRFDAEMIAFRMSRSLFRRFRTGDDNWAETLVDWREDITSRLERVDKELKETTLRDRVRIALETNYLLCLILTSPERPPRAPPEDPDHVSQGRIVLQQLRKSVTSTETLGAGATYLVDSVLLTATAILEPPSTRRSRRTLGNKIDRNFSDDAIEENRITVYDRRRFEFLRDLARAYLTGR